MTHIFGICTLSTSEFRPYSCHDRRLDLLPEPADALGVDAFELDPVEPGVAGPPVDRVTDVD